MSYLSILCLELLKNKHFCNYQYNTNKITIYFPEHMNYYLYVLK